MIVQLSLLLFLVAAVNCFRQYRSYSTVRRSNFVFSEDYRCSSIRCNLRPTSGGSDVDVYNEGDGHGGTIADWTDNEINGRIRKPVPSPLNLLTDVNMDRKSVVFEVTLGRSIGFEIVKNEDGMAAVGEVTPGSKAAELGIVAGDVIIASSATAGDQMWTHDSVEGIRSALNTRFVMSPTVRMRFERKLSSVPADLLPLLSVPFLFHVRVKRPIGIHVVEGVGKGVVVQYAKPGMGADLSGRIEVGDQIIEMSASWGRRLWEINSVDSFVVGVKSRVDKFIDLRIKRMVPIAVYQERMENRITRLELRRSRVLEGGAAADLKDDVELASSIQVQKNDHDSDDSGDIDDNEWGGDRDNSNHRQIQSQSWGPDMALEDMSQIRTLDGLSRRWAKMRVDAGSRPKLNPYDVNKLMGTAVDIGLPNFAIEVFEDACGFDRPASSQQLLAMKNRGARGGDGVVGGVRAALDDEVEVSYDSYESAARQASKILDSKFEFKQAQRARSPQPWEMSSWASYASQKDPAVEAIGGLLNSGDGKMFSSEGSDPVKFLKPNNFICTTAVKAYGRAMETNKALAVMEWMESRPGCEEKGDIYLLSAMLYVCAKAKRVKEAEEIFWEEIPRRNLSYSVPTVNSLMYMYAKLNRPDDALKVYELSKQLGLKGTVATYGVLIKALLRSKQAKLQDTSFEVLRSLPSLGILPGVQLYNQFLEHFANTHDYARAKQVLRMMSLARPRISPDAMSYSYLVNGFANAKKPHSAIAAFRLMRKKKIPGSAYTYMGLLKALSSMRNGLGAVQVLTEMRESGLTPGDEHYTMAMFACVLGDQCALAEALFSHRTKTAVAEGMPPITDTAIHTLYLRALLQQGKWDEGMELINLMLYRNKDRGTGADGEQAQADEARAGGHKDASSFSTGAGRGATKAAAAAQGLNKAALPPRASSQTINCLLQFQVHSGRWEDAAESVDILLQNYRPIKPSTNAASLARERLAMQRDGPQRNGDTGQIQYRNIISPVNSLHDTFRALSFGLGTHSSVLQKIQREDAAFNRNLAAIQKKEGLSATATTRSLWRFERPSKEGLAFLVNMAVKISGYPGTVIQSDFYCELLKALVQENEALRAQVLLELKAAGKVHARPEDNDRIRNTEELVRVACARITQLQRQASGPKY